MLTFVHYNIQCVPINILNVCVTFQIMSSHELLELQGLTTYKCSGCKEYEANISYKCKFNDAFNKYKCKFNVCVTLHNVF